MIPSFQYQEAFSRNLGLVSKDEQKKLRKATVGLAGLGGVGGAHLQSLARMGIGGFHLADLDVFEIANINRQLGATMTTIGQSKVKVMMQMALSINPQVRLKSFPNGIDQKNINNFLQGLDVVVDGIDYFCIETRELLYKAAREAGIPVVNAGPIAYGASVLVFFPAGITFEKYFGIQEEMTHAEKLLAFTLSIAPELAAGIDPKRIDFNKGTGPALAPICLLCAAVAGMEVLKLVCQRGNMAKAPKGIYFNLLQGETQPLTAKGDLLKSKKGEEIRKEIFSRFPGLKLMHDEELKNRARRVAS